MKKKLFVIFTALILAVTFMPAVALADLTFASPPIGDVNWYNEGANGNMGTSFTTASAFTVAKLGFFDSNGDGLSYSHEVGLWNANGTLLGNVTLAAGTIAPLENGFRWANLSSSVLLSPGITYVLGATLLKDNRSDLMGTTATINSPFTRVSSLWHDNVGSDTGLYMPDNVWSTPGGFYGPNLATPIPAAVYLLGTGLVGLFGIRRRFTS